MPAPESRRKSRRGVLCIDIRYLQRELTAVAILGAGKPFVNFTVIAPLSPSFFGVFRPFLATPHFRAIYGTGEPFT